MVETKNLAPDVAIAVACVERVNTETWPQRTAGFTHSQPYVRIDDQEFFEELQGWLAQRSGTHRSFVTAAVNNFRRVLNDLMLVLHHDMQVRHESYWVRKWYHRGEGGSGSWREVEFFSTHTLLIQNLAAELTRALNLVIVRARRADARVLTDVADATVDTGDPSSPMDSAKYSAREQEAPEPYPGLRAFPDVIATRDVGALGEVHAGRPRRPDDFVEWIDELLARGGGHPSSSPVEDTPPRALPRPRAVIATSERRGGLLTHPLLLLLFAILNFASVVAGVVAAQPWLWGAAVGALVAAAVTYRSHRSLRPSTGALAIIGVAAIVCAVVAQTFLRSDSKHAATLSAGSHPPKTTLGGAPARGVTNSLARALECAKPSAQHVAAIFGGLQVASDRFPHYGPRVEARVGDIVTFQLWIQNREFMLDVRNLRAHIATGEQPAITVPVEAAACGSNTYLLRNSASVTSPDAPTQLRFIPDSVNVRSLIEGRWATRGGSDAFFKAADGDVLGRLNASPNADAGYITITAAAKVIPAR